MDSRANAALQEAVLREDVPAPEVFCSGLADVQLIGDGCAAFTLYRNHRPLGRDTMERQIVLRVIAPVSAIPSAVRLMLGAIADSSVAAAWQELARLAVH